MAATFISELDPMIAERVRSVGMLRTYPARSYIFYEGDPGSGVLVVESGLLRIDRSTPSGRVLLLDLAIEGALIGELAVIDGAARSATLSTVTKSTVRQLSNEKFDALLRDDPLIQAAVMARLARRIRSLSTQLLETSTMDAPARIAACLIRLIDIQETLGNPVRSTSAPFALAMPINQQELGQWAGLSREGAVKGLSTLRSIGLIETGRMQVIVHDVSALASFVKS